MYENRNWNEILFSVDALDRRLRAIEEYRRNAPDMSDEALREMRGELDSVRAALGMPGAGPWQAGPGARQENVPGAGWDYRMPSAAYQGQGSAYQGNVYQGSPYQGSVWQENPGRPCAGNPVPNGPSYVRAEPPAPSVQRTNWSERNLGKYLLGVLAAVLVLLAAGVLIAAVWPVIPDVLKFLTLLACGVGLQLVGMRFVLRSENRRNGFWLSVTGLGTGVSLMTVAAGCLAWDLYPLAVAGLLAAVWFGCNLLSAKSLDSPVFYVIAYAGAALAVMLSVGLAAVGGWLDSAPFRLADQVPAAVMPVLILALGGFAAFRHPRRCLRVLNYLAAVYFICLLGVLAAVLALYGNMSAPGWVIASAILAIFAYLIYISPDALERKGEKPGPDWLRVLTVVIAGFIGVFAVYAGMGSVMKQIAWSVDAAAGAAAALAAAAVIVMRRDQADCLLLGLTVPMTVLFAVVSYGLFDLPCLFPVLLCVLLFVLSRVRQRDSSRISLWLSLGLSGIMVLSQSVRRMEMYASGADMEGAGRVLLFMAACFAYLAVLCLTYAGDLRPGNRSNRRPVTLLGCAVLIGLTAAKGVYTAMACLLPDAGPQAVCLGVVAFVLLFHRWYVQAETGSELGTAGLARLLWSVCAGIFMVYLHICTVFASGLEQGVCVMILMAMAGSAVAWAAASGSKAYAVLSVLLANETLAFAGGVNDIHGLALSVLGVCLCAGFIWLGFFKELRTMRRLGLAGMILYVIKIALLDVQAASGNAVSTALGLLLAGLVCFGVSFVYNRLDKKYGGEET